VATSVKTNLDFGGVYRPQNLPTSTAAGQPVVHQQLTALTGALVYQGSWNASTNTPAIPAAAIGNKGYYYVVSVAGTTTINANSVWSATDWIVSNGTTWEKVDNSEDLATETIAGVAEIATQAETDAGTDDQRIVTPLKLATYSGRAKRFSSTFGDGAALTYTITHNLNTQDVVVSIRDVATNQVAIADVTATTVNTVTIAGFSTAPASNTLRATVIG
jgi:hypothetical protein